MTIALTIGATTARSKFTPKAVEIEWDKLPEVSKDFAIRYGLKQYLADGAAGAEDQTDFDGGIAARLANLTSGEFKRTGEGKGPTDDAEVLAKRLAGDEVRAAIKAKGVKIEKELLATLIAKHLESHKDRLTKTAKAQIESRKAAAAGFDLDAAMEAAGVK